MRIEGKLKVGSRYMKHAPRHLLIFLQGFDEFMNLVVDDAVEVKLATKEQDESRRSLGQILLKGDNVALIQSVEVS
jgi:uncharacterized Zn ribbon protein